MRRPRLLRRRDRWRVLLARAGARRTRSRPTIKDLDGQQVDVSPDPPKNVDANKTMDSYKRFLDLNAGDAALRAEALRRLGDLNLESSRIRAHRARTRDQRRLARHRGHSFVLGAAQDLSEVRAQRLGALSAGARLRAQCAARQGAGLAGSAGGAAIPNSHYIDEAQFRRGELLFSDKAYPKAQSAYEAVIKIGAIVRVLQPEPLQARLVAVQAGRERAQPGFLRRRARFGAGIEARSERADRDRHLEPAESRIGGGHLSRHVASPSPTWTVRRPSTSS